MWPQYFNRLKSGAGIAALITMGGLASAQTLPSRVPVKSIGATPAYPAGPGTTLPLETVRPASAISPAGSGTSRLAPTVPSGSPGPSQLPSGAPGGGFGTNASPLTGRAGISGVGSSGVPRTNTDRIL